MLVHPCCITDPILNKYGSECDSIQLCNPNGLGGRASYWLVRVCKQSNATQLILPIYRNGEIKGHKSIIGYGERIIYGIPGMPGPPMTQPLTQF